ncbi:unnamed protein product [Adineta ricciae]|uniref:Uncharacterized protein n=1 Tax=Adineta ricciae TaxID=249248 RepID=A0A816DE71_ADIRI|nr:unnamed protein product [Adineta ricciae]
MSRNHLYQFSHRRKQRRDSSTIRERDNHIQSTGDAPFIRQLLEQLAVRQLSVIHYDDYLYLIYLFLLTIFYICYLTMIFQDKLNFFVDNDQSSYFDNYERQIPRLLWFRKGYQFR